MFKNESRKGLSLGAVFALVASLFFVAPAANAAASEGANIGVRPAAGTSFVGTVVEDFPIYAQLLPGQSNSTFSSRLYWKIEKTSGVDMDVVFQSAGSSVDLSAATSGSDSITTIAAGDTSKSAAATVSPGGVSFLNFKASSTSDVASWSNVVLKITTWIDEVTVGASSGVWDADEWYTVKTVTLYAPHNLTATNTLTATNKDDVWVTASSTITTPLNYQNLTGKFFLAVSSSHTAFMSGTAAQDSSSPIGGVTLTERANVVSSSFATAQVSVSETISMALRYDAAGTGGTYTAGYLVGSVTKIAVGDPGVSSLTLRALADANNTASGTTAAVRPNQTYTIRVAAVTGSTSVSTTVTVAITGTALSWPTKTISVNGAAATASYPSKVSVTTGADGFGTFTLKVSGFEAGEFVSIDADLGNVDASDLRLNMTAPYYTVANAYDLVVTKPNTAVTLDYTVKDQWQQLSSATDQRLLLTRGGAGFNYAVTVSEVAVVGGKASFTFIPEPGTATGSATVTSALQSYNTGALVWANTSGAVNDSAVTINVSGDADSFTTAPTAQVSASVSYAIAKDSYSWSGAVTGYVKNAGAAVTLTTNVAGLIFQDTVTEDTASDTIVLRADSNGQYSFKAASAKSGTYTVSITVGGVTTTSNVVISSPGSDQGASIVWDTTNIVPGKTKIVTGTLVDANGNPVNTEGYGSIDDDATTASLTVTYTGTAGVPVGVMPTETNADGEFKVSLLTATADAGSFTLTAVYNPHGSATTTLQKVTSVQLITVGAETSASADQKITVGTFKGYVAIYTKGYMGQKLSAKVAGKWLVVDPIAAYKSNDYSRTVRLTGAGYTITVDLYIDGAFVRSETVVTK